MSKNLKYTEYTRDFPKTLTGKKKMMKDAGKSSHLPIIQNLTQIKDSTIWPELLYYRHTHTHKENLLCYKAMDSKIFVFFMDLLF